jgi:quercetin dioxygenase-like cupin family protein
MMNQDEHIEREAPGNASPATPATYNAALASRFTGALVVTSLGLFLAACAMAQTSDTLAALKWSVPPLLPAGALLAVVRGDPTAPGQSTLALSMPDGYRLPPHYHPHYEHVEVREKTLMAGMGDRLDPKQTRALTAGDSATAPAGMHHFSIAKGRAQGRRRAVRGD